jgi:hypothetical protein
MLGMTVVQNLVWEWDTRSEGGDFHGAGGWVISGYIGNNS